MESLISVIIAIHKFQSYFNDALQSVLDQDYKAIEVLVVDDSPDDRVQAVIERAADPRVSHVKGNKHGLAGALNLGVRKAKGKYVARMDADDICMPERFRRQIEYITANEIDICGSNIYNFGISHEKVQFPEKDEEIKFSLLFSCPIAHPTVMARREVLEQYPYDIETSAAEDYELWTNLAQRGFRFGNCQDFLLHYRTHRAQASKLNSNQLNNTIVVAKRYAGGYFKSDASRRFIELNCGLLRTYNSEEVREITDILTAEIKRRGLPGKILLRLVLSLYSRIDNYSFNTLRNLRATLLQIECKSAGKAMLIYAAIRSIIRWKIPPSGLEFMEKIYRRMQQ